MTTEELQKNIPKARFAKLQKEVEELVLEAGPIFEALLPVAEKDQELKDRYARFKIPPEWITDLTDNILKEKFPAVFEAMNKEN